jgi:hypothetical protein
MRRSISPVETRIAREAARRAVNPARQSKYSGGGKGSFVGIEGSHTVAVEDGDDILDGHVFMLGEDSLTDPSAFLPTVPDDV